MNVSSKHSLASPVLLLVSIVGLLLGSPPSAMAQSLDSLAQGSQLNVGGYGSFRLDARNAGTQEGAAFTLRRFVVTTDATLGDKFRAYSEVEYERLTEIEVEREASAGKNGIEFEQELEGTNASEIALEQAWGQYNFSNAVGLRFGAVLPPVGRFNINHDDDRWNFTARPLIDRAAQVLPGQAAWTEMGLGLKGSSPIGGRTRISYEAYLLTGTTLDFAIEEVVETSTDERNEVKLEAVVSPTPGAFDGSNQADAGAARIAISPSLNSEYAISGYVGQYTPDFLGTDETLSTIGFDMRQQLGSFYVEGEFLHTWYSGINTVLKDFAETAVDQATETESSETAELKTELEIALDGLADRRYGFWFDVGRPIPLAPGTFGLNNATVTPTVRYERVWLEDKVTEFSFADGTITSLGRGDVEQDRLWVGLAFEPIPQAVFQLFYKRSNPIEGPLIDPAAEGTEARQDVDAVTFGLAIGF